MRLYVGPVAPASAVAWIEWAHEAFGGLHSERAPRVAPCADVSVDAIDNFLDQWKPRTRIIDDAFRWEADVDPDELEYLVHAFFNLDARLLAEVDQGARPGAPDEGRVFYLVLVRALLHALETESPGRAAFVDQLRWSWPSAVEAG